MAIKTNLNKYVREPCYTISIPRPVEMKKKYWGTTNYVLLSVTMVGRRRKFSISNCLKRLEKLNICRMEVIKISINK